MTLFLHIYILQIFPLINSLMPSQVYHLRSAFFNFNFTLYWLDVEAGLPKGFSFIFAIQCHFINIFLNHRLRYKVFFIRTIFSITLQNDPFD